MCNWNELFFFWAKENMQVRMAAASKVIRWKCILHRIYKTPGDFRLSIFLLYTCWMLARSKTNEYFRAPDHISLLQEYPYPVPTWKTAADKFSTKIGSRNCLPMRSLQITVHFLHNRLNCCCETDPYPNWYYAADFIIGKHYSNWVQWKKLNILPGVVADANSGVLFHNGAGVFFHSFI